MVVLRNQFMKEDDQKRWCEISFGDGQCLSFELKINLKRGDGLDNDLDGDGLDK